MSVQKQLEIDLKGLTDEEKIRKIRTFLLDFFILDVPIVVKDIHDIENPIPVEHITQGKRIDLHPAREYLMRISRILNELEEKKADDEGELDIYK